MVTALPGTPARTPALPPLPRRSEGPWRGRVVAEPEAELPFGPTPEAIRRQVRELLVRMASQVDARLPQALSLATRAWERTGSMALIDEETRDALLQARDELRRAVRKGTPDVVALATEALWALRTALAVVTLLESRLPALIRVRTRQVEGEPGTSETGSDELLLPGGRPFLDVGPALAELARRWA